MAGKELAVESGVELLPLRAGGPTLVLGNLSSGVVLAEKVSEIGRLVELKDGKEFFFFFLVVLSNVEDLHICIYYMRMPRQLP
jgi:hypothetical protein